MTDARVVTIEVLFFEGCPNVEETIAMVREVIVAAGVRATVREVRVESAADAERFEFLGSPSVRVGGSDIEPRRRSDRSYAMGCRLYGGSGVPPRALIETALAEHGAT